MKKLLIWILVSALCLSLTACGEPVEGADDGKITIVAAIFPEYDWLRNLTAGSDSIELKLLIDKGVDLHSYQPNVNDIVTVSDCDVFVYSGGASDVWVEDVIETAMNPDLIAVDLMELLEKHRDLCEIEHDHDHEDDHDHEHNVDEHIWLSLVNAAHLCGELTELLCEVDGDNAALYQSNLDRYMGAIDGLDTQYRLALSETNHETILFADRFPFAYLMEDYDLHYYGAYEGCSAETEVSFDTFAELSDTLRALHLPCVVVIDDSDHRIADTVIAASGAEHCEILTLQTMQAVSRRDIKDGITYLGIMDENLSVFERALNGGA